MEIVGPDLSGVITVAKEDAAKKMWGKNAGAEKLNDS